MTESSPTVRRRQLGMALRRLREAANKSQQEAGEWIGVSDTQISKMETGDRKVKLAYVKLLCQMYDVDAPEADFLERLARESDQRGWWADYGNTVPTWFKDFLGMEAAATAINTYHSELVPGLLQVPNYTRAVADGAPPDEVNRIISLRSARQKRLGDDSPLGLHVVLNEAVLLRNVGGSEVMLEQILHLRQMADLPNITIQVLPFSTGFHPAMASSFTLLRFPDTPLLDTVYVDLKGGAVYMEKPADVERYTADFERLGSTLALSGQETILRLQAEIERR